MKSIYQAAVLAALVVLPGVANASLQVGDRIRFTDREGSTAGGEFGVHKKDNPNPYVSNTEGSEIFRTFCLERNEHLDFNTNGFVIDSISKSATLGGVVGGPSDQLEAETAWLYYRFHNGTLSANGYDYGAGRVASANYLQNAIWGFENEINQDATWNANPFVIAAKAAVLANGTDVATAVARVYVLNIKWATDRSGFDGVYESNGSIGEGSLAQSQLYVITPEPATVVVWSALSCIGLLCYRRLHASKLA